uniref:Uncharacterized protein n=1 Tax=Ditylenchus dipsaci TaxID=166011 RepID=A0A915E3F7_9BILA
MGVNAIVKENQEEEDLILECRNKSRCNGPKFVKEMQNPSIYSNTSLFYGLQWEEECTKTNDLPGFAYDALEFIECEGGLQISRVFSKYSDEIKPEGFRLKLNGMSELDNLKMSI